MNGWRGRRPPRRRANVPDCDKELCRGRRAKGSPRERARLHRRRRRDGRHPAARALAEALRALGYQETDDLSGQRQEGVAWPDLAIAERAADLILGR